MAKTALDQYKEKVRAAIIEEAESRGWCDDVNDFLEGIDLKPMEREYSVVLSITVKAEDDCAACDKVEEILNKISDEFEDYSVDYAEKN